MTLHRTFAAAFTLLAIAALTVAVRADTDPIDPSDLIGTWKTKDGKQSFTVSGDGGALMLHSHYNDWRVFSAFNPATGAIGFDRVATTDDIRAMKLDKAQDPPPDDVVSGAAGVVTEGFFGIATRDTHWYSSERCDLAMNVRWRGFHIAWDANGAWHSTTPEPKSTGLYHLVRYAFFDTTKYAIQTSVNDASSITGDQRVLLGTEVQDYFNDPAATALFGQFTKALFEPIFDGVTGIVPAETIAGKIATSLLKTSISNSLTGSDTGVRDFAKIATEQVLDSVLGAAGSREPFASIRTQIDNVYGEDISDWLTSTGAGKVKGAASGGIDSVLTAAQSDALAKYLKTQCRIRIASLPAHGAVTGGIVIADTQLGTARILLHLSAHGTRPAVNVQADVGIPPEGQPPTGIPIASFNIIP